MTKIISISITEEEKAFLELMDLSPTGLFKQRIEQVKRDSSNYQKKLLELEEIIRNQNKTINEQDLLIEEYSKKLADFKNGC